MQLVFSIVVLALVLLLVQEGFQRMSQSVAWFIFLVLPISLTPYWILCNEFGLFAWAKLYTILLTACWLTLLRFTPTYHRRWARTGMITLFAFNILEAVAVDLATWRIAPGLNAIAGIFLVAMLPRSASAINRTGDPAKLHFEGLGRTWIIAFTLWNLTFLYINYTVIFGHHIAVLGVAMIIGLKKPQCWLQARIHLLAIDLVVLATFGPSMIPSMDTSKWHVPHWETVAAGTTFVFVLTNLAIQSLACKLHRRPTRLVPKVFGNHKRQSRKEFDVQHLQV